MTAETRARRDPAPSEVARPTEQMRRWAVAELRDRVRHGRAGDEAVALLLDAYDAVLFDRPSDDAHYRAWLRANGWLDEPELAPS